MKAFKAGIRIYGHHLSVVLFSIFLVIPFFSIASKLPFLFSFVTVLLYILVLYPLGWNYGKMDSRNIEGFYPDYKFPFKASVISIIIPVILLLIRIAFPDIWHIDIPFVNGETDFFLTGVKLSGTTDMIFKIWYFPLCAFLSNGNIFIYFIWIFFQPALFIVGYFLGLKRFSLMSVFLSKVVYNKDKKKG